MSLFLRCRSVRFASLACALLCVVTMTPAVHAQDASPNAEQAAQAEALFERGKEAMAAHDYARACPLLAESYSLDPATGSLLALAICHEWEGKIAVAFRGYQEVVARSQTESRPDREQAAQARVAALEGALSTLTLRVVQLDSLDGVSVRLDDTLLDPSMFNIAIPVDGGAHVLTASAAGKQTFRTDVTLASHHDTQIVMLPALRAAPGSVGSLPIVLRSPIVRPLLRAGAPPEPRRPAALQWAGATVFTAGLLSLGTGALIALKAVHDNNVVNSGCSSSGCVEDPPHEPLSLGSGASIAFATGGLLSGAGIVLMILGRRSTTARQRERAWLVSPWAAHARAGAALSGRF